MSMLIDIAILVIVSYIAIAISVMLRAPSMPFDVPSKPTKRKKAITK